MNRSRAARRIAPILAPILALTALGSAQVAQAQQSCVKSADLNDTITYAMPIAYDAAMAACSKSYAANGFMKTKGTDFAGRFRAKQSASWPGAFRLLKTFVAKEAGGSAGASAGGFAAMIDSLPPETLRPLVDAYLQQTIAGEIKPDSCGKIERAVSLISPLPVENVSGLATFIAEMAEIKNPTICSAIPLAAAKSAGKTTK